MFLLTLSLGVCPRGSCATLLEYQTSTSAPARYGCENLRRRRPTRIGTAATVRRVIQETLANKLDHPLFGRLAFIGLKLLGIELPRSVKRGTDLTLAHGAVGLVVHERTRIGDRVRLYQGVTIGRADVHRRDQSGKGGVVICDDVIIGANAIVLFASGETRTIGEGALIGAGSIVNSDVPAWEIWAGAPARRVAERSRNAG